MAFFPKERILITGVTGFVGYNLARFLYARGVKHVYGIANHADKACPGVKLSAIDLLDHKEVIKYAQRLRPTIVFHLAAYVMLERDYQTACRTFDVNVQGTVNLLDALIKIPKVKRLVFASTEEVYGRGSTPYKEDQAILPPSPYAISKIAGEHFCLLYNRLYSLPSTILRLSTMYGPFQPATRFIPRLIKSALLNKQIKMNSGKSARDYIYIDDAVDALVRAVLSKKAEGEIINIGNSSMTTGRELIQLILKQANSCSAVKYGGIAERVGEALEWRADIKKAKRLLGWNPRFTLARGLKKTVDYYRDESLLKF